MREKLAVYTMAIGADFKLAPAPDDGTADYICFTDRSAIDANGWQVKTVRPLLRADPTRSSREFKICPHRCLNAYGRSIYIDSNVSTKVTAEALWSALVPQDTVLFGGFWHPSRRKLLHEFTTVRRKKLDQAHVLDEQLDHYMRHYSAFLEKRPVWGGVLARRHHHPNCIAAMETWFAHVLRYARRDQLSLPVALGQFDEGQASIRREDIRRGPLIQWQSVNQKKPDYYIVPD